MTRHEGNPLSSVNSVHKGPVSMRQALPRHEVIMAAEFYSINSPSPWIHIHLYETLHDKQRYDIIKCKMGDDIEIICVIHAPYTHEVVFNQHLYQHCTSNTLTTHNAYSYMQDASIMALGADEVAKVSINRAILHLDQRQDYYAETGIFRVIGQSLPRILSSSTAMILTRKKRRSIVFHAEEYKSPPQLQCWWEVYFISQK